MTQKANLRVCACCEWIWKRSVFGDACPKCEFGSYGARYVYGEKCYQYAKNQKPWLNNQIQKLKTIIFESTQEKT